MKQIMLNRELTVLLKDIFAKFFWRRSGGNFDFLSCGIKFQQKIKKFMILIDSDRNLTIFQTKETKFHNEFFPNHASEKYETNHYN